MSSKDESRPFQLRVVDWMMETFSMEVCRDTTERNHRFLEESLELVQSMGCTVAEAHMLVDYVFGRPVGEPEQEVGGAMVTLAALCAAADFSMTTCGDTELARCWKNIERIRAKQAAKPKHSPLPGPSVETPAPIDPRLWEVIDRVIVKVPFEQKCFCERCTAMRDLQQISLASVNARRAEKTNGDVP